MRGGRGKRGLQYGKGARSEHRDRVMNGEEGREGSSLAQP